MEPRGRIRAATGPPDVIDAILTTALGFLVASLIGLMVLPAITRRADRLARRRAEAAFPLSLEQVAAERDHLRAELALRERAFERRAEEAEAMRATALSQAGERDVANAALERDLAARREDIAGLESVLAAMTADRDRLQGELEAETARHGETTASLGAAQGEISRLESVLHERAAEIGALIRRRGELEQDVAGLEAVKASLELRLEEQGARIDSLIANVEALKGALAGEKAAHASVVEAKGSLEAAFMARGQELDAERRLALDHAGERDQARIALSEARQQQSETARALEESARRIGRLQADIERDRASLGAKLTRAEEKSAGAVAAKREADQAIVELRADRARLKQEAAAMKRQLATAEASLKGEQAALRREIKQAAQALLAARQAAAVRPPEPAANGAVATAPGPAPARSRAGRAAAAS
jgi:chromosome segregation ATPase